MSEQPSNLYTLEGKVAFRIADPAAVQQAAVARLSSPDMHFESDDARQEEIVRVQLSVEGALLTLLDIARAIEAVPGAEEVIAVMGIEPGDTVL